MNVIDYDMAAIVQQHLRDKDIRLKLKDGVSSFARKGSILEITLSSGTVLKTDMVILSIGVRPDTALAREAGLEVAQNGAIKVDEFFATSDPSIRAVGDAIELKPAHRIARHRAPRRTREQAGPPVRGQHRERKHAPLRRNHRDKHRENIRHHRRFHRTHRQKSRARGTSLGRGGNPLGKPCRLLPELPADRGEDSHHPEQKLWEPRRSVSTEESG